MGSIVGRFVVIPRVCAALSVEPCGAEKRADPLHLDIARDPAFVVTGSIQMNRPAIDQGADDIYRPVLRDQHLAAHWATHGKAYPALIGRHGLMRVGPHLSSPRRFVSKSDEARRRSCKKFSRSTSGFRPQGYAIRELRSRDMVGS